MNNVRHLENQFKDFVVQAVAPHINSLSNLKKAGSLSSQDEDTRLSFDMKIGNYAEVAVRLRKNEYLKFRDFSIRSQTKHRGQELSNGETVTCEIDKIRKGLGQCYFYGWLDSAGQNIVDYIIVDVDAFRPYLDNHSAEKPNAPYDGTAARYYSINLLYRCGALIFDAKGRCAA